LVNMFMFIILKEFVEEETNKDLKEDVKWS
jgi:hypothetical protein